MGKIVQFFSPPYFADEEHRHQAWLLHTILWTLMFAVTVIEILDVFLLPRNAGRWWSIILFVNTTNLFLIQMNRRGRLRLASVLVVFEIWLVVTLLILNGGGIHSPVVAVYLLVVFGAGLLLGQRAGIFVGCLCSLTLLAMVIVETTGQLPENRVHDTVMSLWVAYLLYITMMISLQVLATRTIQKALSRARDELAERKRAEQILRENDKRYSIVVEQTGQIVYDYNVTTGKLDWLGAITRVTGYTAEEFQKVDIKGWEEMVHPDDRLAAVKSLELAMRTVGRYNAEYRFRRKDGSYIHIKEHGIFLPDPFGESKRMLGTMTDVSARKQAEVEKHELTRSLDQRVRQRTAELEAANRELEAFSYSVSHDLRAPLRHIKGFAQILVEDHKQEMSAEASDLLDKICADTERMEQLINDLLALSRAGRQPLQTTCIDLHPIVREMVVELQKQQKERRIELGLEALPKCFGDVSLLKQVFFNLIANSLKFTRDRSPAKIVIGCAIEEEQIYFVRDNGAGFDMKYADKLFGAFQRLHSDKEFEGTGIGLSIVQRIVHRHGGRIWAESAVDQGTTFYFTLPACPSGSELRR